MGLSAYVLATLGLGTSPYIPSSALPPVEQMRPPTKPRPRAIGGAGTFLRSGLIDSDDPNTEVQGYKWYGQPGSPGIAAKIIRDPHVRQSIAYITAPLRAATWRFRPGDDSPLAREIADFCQWAFVDSHPWDEVLRRMVSQYALYGFTLQEMTDAAHPVPARFANHPGGGVGIIPTGFHDRPAWTVHKWLQSSSNPAQLSGVEQWLMGADGEKAGFRAIPANRLIRITCEQEGANFEGIPVARSAYGAWKLKTLLLALDAMKHERFALGVPYAEAPEDASDEDIDAAESALAEFRAHEKLYLMLPAGWKTGILSTNTGDGTDLNQSIERCNKDIAINVAAGFMLLGLTGKSGSYALGATQQGLYHLSTEGHARTFADAFNFGADGWSPVRRIVELNYGSNAPVPRLEARNLPTRDWPEVMKLAVSAKQAGLMRRDDPTEARVREILQFDPFDPDTAETVEAAPVDDAAQSDAEPVDAPEDAPVDEDAMGRDPQAVSPTEALNGAQVTSLRQLILDVATKQLPRETGVRAIAAAFPLSESEADRVMDEVGRGFFSEAPASPPPFGAPPADDEGEPADDDNPDDEEDDTDA